MEEYVQIATTVATAEEAGRIAKLLVEKRLAACVQVLPAMTSYYRWQGKIENAGEHLCLIKSRKDLFPEVEAAIKSVHPYEVPEIIALPICAGSQDYLTWLGAALAESS
ncbi:divalent-cation tolerance protein CutA [Thiovibrio sp. JS02]